MQSTALLRTFVLGLALAGALPQSALAGHEQLVAQHRLTRAELIGVLYLPGGAGTGVAQSNAAGIAVKPCDDIDAHPCDAAMVSP